MKQLQSVSKYYFRVTLACLLLGLGSYILLVTLSPALSILPIIRSSMTKHVETALTKPPSKQNRLYIPKLGISIKIATGPDESALLHAAWDRKPENGNPKDGGNYALSAHRFSIGLTPQGTVEKSPFYHIDELAIGNKISVDYEGKRYQYVITRTYKVNPQQVTIEARTIKPILTLYSCTLRGSADGRDVIEARPIKQTGS